MITKVEDPILTAWERTRANNRDRAAIFDSRGEFARTFSEIEDRARQIAGELEKIAHDSMRRRLGLGTQGGGTNQME